MLTRRNLFSRLLGVVAAPLLPKAAKGFLGLDRATGVDVSVMQVVQKGAMTTMATGSFMVPRWFGDQMLRAMYVGTDAPHSLDNTPRPMWECVQQRTDEAESEPWTIECEDDEEETHGSFCDEQCDV